jgi:tripartite ATP-independent transporter DctP family solute receptor
MLLVVTVTGCTGGTSKTNSNSGGTTSSEPASSGEPLVLKLANGSAVGDERDKSLIKFAELVDQKSNGKIEIKVYSGGTLGSWRDTIEGLEPGIVQIVCESIGTLEAYSSTASIDAYPYLYRDVDHYTKVMDSEIGQELLDTVAKEGGFVLLGPSNRGARIMTTTKKIENAGDLKGLKLRAPGIKIYIKTWEYLGASPTPMDPSEIYTGIQQGTVDGQENPVLYSYGAAFYDVCKYLIISNHVFSTDVFIFNDDYFNSLPADVQDILKEAAKEAGQYRTQLVLDTEQEYIEKFKEKGVEVIYPDLESFRAKLVDFDKEFPNLSDLVKKIQSVK